MSVNLKQPRLTAPERVFLDQDGYFVQSDEEFRSEQDAAKMYLDRRSGVHDAKEDDAEVW